MTNHDHLQRFTIMVGTKVIKPHIDYLEYALLTAHRYGADAVVVDSEGAVWTYNEEGWEQS